jgi:hypothetical protein
VSTPTLQDLQRVMEQATADLTFTYDDPDQFTQEELDAATGVANWVRYRLLDPKWWTNGQTPIERLRPDLEHDGEPAA